MSFDAMMDAWKDAHKPGDHHKHLHKMVGEFDGVAEFKTAPGAPPMIEKATMTSTLEFGGRFVRSVYESQFMGEPFTGIAYIGYDNDRKHYSSLWMDSMSTGMSMSTGECSDSGDEWVMWGEAPGPTGEFVKSKHVYKLTDAGYTMEFYKETPEGMMHEGTITYTRR